MNNLDDTIAAISTAPGTGGIAVIRLSGAEAVPIVDSIFVGKTRLRDADSQRALVGRIVAQNGRHDLSKTHFLDEAVVTVFRAPNSYTRQDVVEISCHGGKFLSRRILELCIENGCRLAEPGEFTQRAFLNGRLDLSQAEAVADLIAARTEASLKSAGLQFQGALSQRVGEMREGMLEVCALLELELDFAEEDVEFANREEVQQRLSGCIGSIEAFSQTYERGKILREGARLVILGKPNVGKSSLLNALLKEERAIVTDIPGTTRDVLEEQLDIRGVFFRIIDTAGMRTTTDIVERAGVERSYRQIDNADIILAVFDGARQLDNEDRALVERLRQQRQKMAGNQPVMAVINKRDLPQQLQLDVLRTLLQPDHLVSISARDHSGLSALEDILVESVLGSERDISDEPLVSNLRQRQALERSLDSLRDAQVSIQNGLSGEFVVVDLRQGIDALGEIIGEVTTEDILGTIFSKFCIGK